MIPISGDSLYIYAGTITMGTQIRPQASLYTTISLSEMLAWVISLQEQSFIAHTHVQSHYTFRTKIASAETAVQRFLGWLSVPT